MTKQRKSDVVAAMIAVILVCLAMAFLTGCLEEQQAPKQWGNGDLPVGWQETFGTENMSRLNFVQSRVIDQLAARVRTLEINQYVPDPNALRDMSRRISELENGND